MAIPYIPPHAPITTNKELKDAIARVVDYNWRDEQLDYERCPDNRHIFSTLCALHAWITEED